MYNNLNMIMIHFVWYKCGHGNDTDCILCEVLVFCNIADSCIFLSNKSFHILPAENFKKHYLCYVNSSIQLFWLHHTSQRLTVTTCLYKACKFYT